METPEALGKRLWAFMNDPENQTSQDHWVHINWGPIPILFIRSEADAIRYYMDLERQTA